MTGSVTNENHDDEDDDVTSRARISRRGFLRATAGAAALAGCAPASPDAEDEERPIPTSLTFPPTVPATTEPQPSAQGFRPDTRYVAIYGHPGIARLGVLGSLPVEGAVAKARELAEPYERFGLPVIPSFELIVSVAAADPGADGDYSNEFDPETFRPWLDAAEREDLHVIVDLQTGRSRFPDQALEYEPLLVHPNVSVALDPEWRFNAPGIPGGGRIGTVGAGEINQTVVYLDGLIRAHGLPPKMLIVHQFTDAMVTAKRLIQATPNVQIVLHMDGFGSPEQKRNSYARMLTELPPGALTGWKNFLTIDSPLLSPEETLSVAPEPILISYQ